MTSLPAPVITVLQALLIVLEVIPEHFVRVRHAGQWFVVCLDGSTVTVCAFGARQIYALDDAGARVWGPRVFQALANHFHDLGEHIAAEEAANTAERLSARVMAVA